MFSSGCRRGILALASGGGFNPLVLFASGEQGGWWDPSDLTTMFQDSAGTTPVTAAGQSVGLIRDKSGRGNHRSQATAGSRPTLQQDASGFYYLLHDGVDDFMNTPSVDLSAINKITFWTGLFKASDVAVGIYCEHGSAIDTLLNAPRSAGVGNYGADLRGGATTTVTTATFTAPISNVVCVALDRAGATATDQIKVRVNGILPAQSVGNVGPSTGNFTNNPFYFGARLAGASPFSGREYQSIVRAAASTADQITAVERYVGARMGIVL